MERTLPSARAQLAEETKAPVAGICLVIIKPLSLVRMELLRLVLVEIGFQKLLGKGRLGWQERHRPAGKGRVRAGHAQDAEDVQFGGRPLCTNGCWALFACV